MWFFIFQQLKKRGHYWFFVFWAYFYCFWGNYERAALLLQNLAEREKISPKLWGKLGDLYFRLGKYSLARKAFLHGLKGKQKKCQFLFRLGQIEEAINNLTFAQNIYLKCLTKEESAVEVLLSLGNLLFRLGNFEQAITYYYRLIGLDITSAEIYNNLGICHLKLGGLTLAASFLKKAAVRKPKDPNIICNYALVFIKKAAYREALLLLQKVKKFKQVRVYSFLGYCYSLLGEYRQGLACYQEVLALEPTNRDNLVNLACTYAHLGEYQKARSILQKLLIIIPHDPELLNNLAWVYEAINDYETAEKNYYRGLALAPRHPELNYNLICCLFKQQKYYEAWEKIVFLKNMPEWKDKAWAAFAHLYENMGEEKLAVDCYNKAYGLN